MQPKKLILLFLLYLLSVSWGANGFCGFYVAKADSQLYNKASQVIYVRDGDRNALTLVNDFKGELSEFALVVPVPEVLTREQINVADKALVERVDAFSAPRLVEYFDPDPCAPIRMYELSGKVGGPQASPMSASGSQGQGVTIEAQYTVGEYDILILNAKESSGLEAWLIQNGYKIPKGASRALEPYIKQGLKFFVAKVNLKEQVKAGFTYLRPLQFAFESPKFMLPIRLGMINADGPQDLLIYVITKKGRVETTNYRSVRIPSEMDVPLYVKRKFSDFYRDMFSTSHEKENRKVIFLEYAWNMAWCDPCAADPLKPEELRKIGVFWLDEVSSEPGKSIRLPIWPPPGPGPVQAFITRLHVRYDAKVFPEDLFFQETNDSENFQGRYILRHEWTGEMKCVQAESYRQQVKERKRKEVETLASLTGWSIKDIRNETGVNEKSDPPKKWFQKIFK